MKWKLGAMFDFLDLTRLKASLRLREHLYMRYATVIVTEREIPAKQWTSTPFFFDLASSAKKRKLQLISTTYVEHIAGTSIDSLHVARITEGKRVRKKEERNKCGGCLRGKWLHRSRWLAIEEVLNGLHNFNLTYPSSV